jgi:hypothetical protein
LRNFDFESTPSARMMRSRRRHNVALGGGISVFRVAKLIAANIVWSQMLDARQFRIFAHHPPDRFLAETATPNVASSADATEDNSTFNTCNSQP